LAWMAASKFLSHAAIWFKLGRAPPSELLTHSNSAARAFGHQVWIGQRFTRWRAPEFESDGRIQ
jgi:hypothetical protein